jgi:hypothetical protein
MLAERALVDRFRVRALESRLPTLEEAFVGIVGQEGTA